MSLLTSRSFPRSHLLLPSLTTNTTTGPPSTLTSRSTLTVRQQQQTHRQRPVRLSKRESPSDDTWLVDSPRKIQFEKTMMGVSNPLSDALEMYYEHIVIPEDVMSSARAHCDELMDYIMLRMSKLANNIGMKILGRVYAGSTFTDSQVLEARDIDVYVTFERHKTKPLEHVKAGYTVIPLKRHRTKKGTPPDKWRFGRSDDELYISALKVATQMWFLVERALKLHPTAMLQPLTHEDGKSQIQVKYSELNINIIPACFLDHKDDIYLVSRPYSNDIDPTADALWRWSYFNKERRILARMANADRGARRRAFLCMKALIAEEHTLQGLTSYHIKTVLMHSFDETVDSTPRWQRNTIDSCFITLLQELSMFLDEGVLPNFFLRSQNLLETMTPRLLATLKSRVGFLAQNHGEVRRILRKHCNTHELSIQEHGLLRGP